MQVQLGYPTLEEEDEILIQYQRQDPMDALEPVVDSRTILALQSEVRSIHISDDIRRYILEVVRSTRDHDGVDLGVSPRGSLALFRAAQALAALRGRDYVIPSDVQHLAPPLLTHRIHISPQTRLRGRTPEQVVAEIAERVPVPVAE
jgi:MoxR-like ATPase